MNQIPRSVERLALGYGPLPPPWPVTVKWRMQFGVPVIGGPAPPTVSGKGWAYLAASVRSAMRPARDDDAQRVKSLFAKIARANAVDGLNWMVMPFDSRIRSGFGVPDGTVFVSSGLADSLSDDELIAVIAHLMGHERYQHYAQNLQTARTMRFATEPGPIVPEAPPPFPEALTRPRYAYTRWQEIEANRVAIDYLAKIDIPPDTLFDALAKLSSEAAASDEWPSFSLIHHLPANAFDLGKLLDTGDLKSP